MAGVLLVIDPDIDATWVLDAAGELASDMGATVRAVAVDDVESQRFSPLPRSEIEERARSRAQEAAQRLMQAGIETDWEVRQGRAVEAVLAAARDVEAEIIVVGGSPRRPVVERVLGSLALELVRHADRQVLVVTPPRT